MNHRIDFRPIIIGIMFLLSLTYLTAQFSGGEGTAEHPYLVSTVEDLYLVRDYRESYFKQINNISLDIEPWNEGEGWEPIGSPYSPFLGQYDGDGYLITNVTIERYDQSKVGLFGFANGARLKNIIIDSLNVVAYSTVGGLVGYSYYSVVENCEVTGVVEGANYYTGVLAGRAEYSRISNCSTSGEVRGYGDVGGLMGVNNNSTVIHSSSSVEVEGDYTLGGLVGYNVSGYCCRSFQPGGLAGSRETAIIEYSFAAGSVRGSQDIGGLVGLSYKATVKNSYATGEVNGDWKVGGLVGTNTSSEIIGSFASGNTAGQYYIGGLVGFSNAEEEIERRRSENRFSERSLFRSYSQIADSYSKGAVTGIESIGGLVGYLEETDINNCYSLGTVTGDGYIGGLVGRYVLGNVTGCYWNIETSGIDYSDAGEGRTSDEMRPPYHDTFINWDFEEVWADDLQNQNDGFPIFVWQIGEIDPNPTVAQNPYPKDGEKDVTVELDSLSWSYYHLPEHSEPVGFRVYMNITGEFDEEEYNWIDYEEDREDYSLLLQEYLPLEYETVYYWMVVPTTIYPDNEEDRGDAEDIPRWFFITEKKEETEADLPQNRMVTQLRPNYPNPFNPITEISFTLAEGGAARVDIYNVRGQSVAQLIDGYLPAGNHTVTWRGENDNGMPLGSGVYYYRLKVGEYEAVRKMLMVK